MLISLMGYMGSGKTTLAKDLAEKLNYKLIDLDNYIEQTAGKAISEIFAEGGEIKFRKIEREVLLKILEEENDAVIALGGGTPVYYDNTAQITEHTTSIYLRMTPPELYNRLVKEKESRPMISHLKDEDLLEFIAKHLFERRNYYEQAKFTIDVKEKEAKEISEEINHLLQLS